MLVQVTNDGHNTTMSPVAAGGGGVNNLNNVNNDERVCGRAPSILDSPTLARVERARLRHEGLLRSGSATPERDNTTSLRNNSLLMAATRAAAAAGVGGAASGGGAIKRGLLWQQRDRLFSRWKERYFVLTRDYLHCFKRCTGGASQMGEFIFKIKLVDVVNVQWSNRKSYSAVCLDVGREGRILLRTCGGAGAANDGGLEDWFELLEECTLSSKERRRALRRANEARSRASLAAPIGCGGGSAHHSIVSGASAMSAMSGGTIDSALEAWLLNRHKTLNATSHFPLCDSVPDLTNNGGGYNNGGGGGSVEVTMRRPPQQQFANNGASSDFYRKPQGPLDHRLSLLTDIDLGGCDSGLDTPPSTCKAAGEMLRPSSYRDVFFMAAPNMLHDCSSAPRRTSASAQYRNKPHHGGGGAGIGHDTSNNMSGMNANNTNTGDSSSRGTMLTPGGSFRSNASNSNRRHFNLNGNHPSLTDQMSMIVRKPNAPDVKSDRRHGNNGYRQHNDDDNKQYGADDESSNNLVMEENSENLHFYNDNNDVDDGVMKYYPGDRLMKSSRHNNSKYSSGNNAENNGGYSDNVMMMASSSLLRDNKYGGGGGGAKRIQEQFSQKYRDRSYSDIQQMDKRQWKMNRDETERVQPRRASYLVHLPSRV